MHIPPASPWLWAPGWKYRHAPIPLPALRRRNTSPYSKLKPATVRGRSETTPCPPLVCDIEAALAPGTPLAELTVLSAWHVINVARRKKSRIRRRRRRRSSRRRRGGGGGGGIEGAARWSTTTMTIPMPAASVDSRQGSKTNLEEDPCATSSCLAQGLAVSCGSTRHQQLWAMLAGRSPAAVVLLDDSGPANGCFLRHSSLHPLCTNVLVQRPLHPRGADQSDHSENLPAALVHLDDPQLAWKTCRHGLHSLGSSPSGQKLFAPEQSALQVAKEPSHFMRHHGVVPHASTGTPLRGTSLA